MRIMVASRWPWRLPRAASIGLSTSPGVSCSRVPTAPFFGRRGVTVRISRLGVISIEMRIRHGNLTFQL
jgi:hypothetical protein